MTGNGDRQVMDASSSGKRKSSGQPSSDSEVSAAKIHVKEYANTPLNTSCSSATSNITDAELTVVISGRNRPLKHYHPSLVNNAIREIIGNYDKIKVLPSGDLALTCKRLVDVKAMLDRDCLTYSTTNIPVKTSRYTHKPYGCRVVVTGIPLDVTDSEMMEALSQHHVTFVKRLKRKSDKGYVNSLSYLLCFKNKTPPEFINFGYLRLPTKSYNPPPQRCFKCNRYGHKRENCRGKACCSKCGSRQHEYSTCPNEVKKCVNCHGCHSAAYGGCIIYKQEAKIQVIKEKSNISYQQAKELVISQAVTRNPRNVPSEIASRPFYSQVARRKNQTSSMQRPSEPAMQHQTQDPKECSIDIPAQPVPIEQTQTQLQKYTI